MPTRLQWSVATALMLSLVATCPLLIHALHEDEAGKNDWYVQGTGVASLVAFAPRSRENKAVYMASESNVVASLRHKTGDIRWRQPLGETDRIVCLVPMPSSTLAVVTSSGTLTLYGADGSARSSASLPLGGGTPVACNDGFGSAESPLWIIVAAADGDDASTVGRVSFSIEQGLSDDVKDKKKVPLAALHGAKWSAAGPSTAFALTASSQVVYIDFAAASARVSELPRKLGEEWKLVFAAGSDIAVANAKTAQFVTVAFGGSDVVVSSPTDELALPFGRRDAVISAKKGLITFESGKAVDFDEGSAFLQVLKIRSSDATTSAADAARFEIAFVTDDGHLHYIDATPNAALHWSRKDGISEPLDVCFGESLQHSDKFGFNQRVFVLSRRGRVYALTTKLPTASSGSPVLWSRRVPREENVKQIAYCRSEYGLVLKASAFQSEKTLTWHIDDGSDFSAPSATADHLRVAARQRGAPQFTIDEAAGVLQGYAVNDSGARVETWRVNFGNKLVAVAAGHSPFQVAVVEHLRFFPAADTAKGNEVRRKFPLANVAVVAYYPTSTATGGAAPADVLEDDEASGSGSAPLIVAAVDVTTGGILATAKHADVEGNIHIAVAEHMVFYHFFNARRAKYFIAVWELFEHQDIYAPESAITSPALVVTSFISKRRAFNSAASRSPLVSTQVLAFPSGAITSLGVTVSKQGIARKQVVFCLSNGRVVSTPLISLQITAAPATPPAGYVPGVLFIPSTNALSHKHRVHTGAGPSPLVATAPTPLESTSHVLVIGTDLFYTRASSGKPFDLLNDDFNRKGLLIVCAALLVATFVVKRFAEKKSLKLLWS